MKPRSILGTVAMGLLLAPSIARAQRVSAEVVLGPIDYRSRIADRPVFRMAGGDLEVSFWYPRRGYVVVERYEVFRPRVATIRLRRAGARAWLRRHGYRPVTVFIRDGRLYRRHWSDRRGAGNPNLRAVVLWERHGRFVRVVFSDGPRRAVRRGADHYDRRQGPYVGTAQEIAQDDGWYAVEDFDEAGED